MRQILANSSRNSILRAAAATAATSRTRTTLSTKSCLLRYRCAVVARSFGSISSSIPLSSVAPAYDTTTTTTTTTTTVPPPAATTTTTRRRRYKPIYILTTNPNVSKTSITLSILSGIRRVLGEDAKIGYLRPVTILQEHEDPLDLQKQHQDEEGPKNSLDYHHHDHEEPPDFKKGGNEDDSPLVAKYLYSISSTNNNNNTSSSAASSPSSSIVQILDDGSVHTPTHSTPTSSSSQSNRLRHLENIRSSYEKLVEDVDVLVIQGAGHHAAVGTFAGMGNARMARNLGGSVVLVGGGGIGATFDELEVNRVLCQVYNVPIAGVVLNKVNPQKLQQTSHYIRNAISQCWGAPLLGCIPNKNELSQPTLHDLELLFETSLVSGTKWKFRRYDIGNMVVVTTSLNWFLNDICWNHQEEDEEDGRHHEAKRKLYVCHGSRDDIVLGFLAEYQRRKMVAKQKGHSFHFESALVICGRGDDNEEEELEEGDDDHDDELTASDGHQWGKGIVSDEVYDLIRAMNGNKDDDDEGGVPILLTKHSTHVTSEMIRAYRPRLNSDDGNHYNAICNGEVPSEDRCDRVDRVVDFCQQYLDVEELLKRTMIVEEEEDFEQVAR